jgi:hypothetical protein
MIYLIHALCGSKQTYKPLKGAINHKEYKKNEYVPPRRNEAKVELECRNRVR